MNGGFSLDDSRIYFKLEDDKVLFGDDPTFHGFVVTIVRPDVQRKDRAKLTMLAENETGNRFLLREGWLKANSISRAVRADFSKYSGLEPVAVTLKDGSVSRRDWYLVAALGKEQAPIRDQTVDFILACAQARIIAGRAGADDNGMNAPRFGKDERGRIYRTTAYSGERDVIALQGYVWEALKKILGKRLTKNTKTGYCADGVIGDISVLLEIKTGTSARDVYEGAGQLILYPSVLDLPHCTKPILLTPDLPIISAALRSALQSRNIEHFTYSLGVLGREPVVKFSEAFLERCQPSANEPFATAS